MGSRFFYVLVPFGLISFQCGEQTQKPFDDSVVYSCQYTNQFTGAECKQYVGSKWHNQAVLEADCGSGFVEQNAVLVDQACPDQVEQDGQALPARALCHTAVGQPEEMRYVFYVGELNLLESSCESMLQGTFEALTDDDQEVEVYELMPEAIAALQSTSSVSVSSQCADADCLQTMIDNTETFDFMPSSTAPQAGLVFYPGGRVDPRSYAPAAQLLAEKGLFVSIIPMKDYMASNGTTRADDVRQTFPSIENWYVGGHSMGATIAARYGTTPGGQTVNGIVIWASVPDKADDLSQRDLAVLSIFATLDSGNPPSQVEEHKKYLPPDTVYVEIEGGDHCQFGYYLDDNNPATISREKQHELVTNATVDFIKNAR